ncbi:restriction endonuclease [Chloroflexota bacterium]
MSKKARDGKELEEYVANAYRLMGAWKVEQDLEVAGNQIDVYVEMATPGRLLHRIVVEAKDWSSTVGIGVVNRFGHIVQLLHGERLVDEGIIVSASGFSRPARRAALTYGLRLLEPADLGAMVAEAQTTVHDRPSSLPILSLSDPCLAHPYPLQENFTGRVHERQMLTEWLVGGGRPLLTLIAIGGMGKSALTWAWLQRDVLGLPLPDLTPDSPEVTDRCHVPENEHPEGVLWWSFYERESSFAAFVDRALAYASEGRVDPAELLTLHDKVRALIDLLNQHRLLVVLDGFERELRAYASLSAVYQGDTVTEDARDDYRACSDPHAANFLRWVAAIAIRSRVLLTSRLFPRELDGLAGCQREDLAALDPDDAVSFFRAQGVQGTRAEIQAACQPYGYHPLALRLLSGMAVRDPAHPGDVAAAAEYSPLPHLVPQEHHILALAYNALSPLLRELLSRLAAFRSPVEYEVAAMLSPFEGKRELGLAFRELVDRGLIFFDQERWRYDLHPIVRAYAYDRLVDKEGVHLRLRDYFSAVLSPDVDRADSVEDLAPIVELYHHTVRAGWYDEAADLFHDRLSDPLYFRFGAYQTEIDLLRALFPDHLDPVTGQWARDPASSDQVALPRLTGKSAQAWTLNAMASSYSCSGQLRSALPLLEMHNRLQSELGEKQNLAIGLENLASVELELGELAAADRNLRRIVEWASKSGDFGLQASGHRELGRLLAYRGSFDEARLQLDTATEIEERISPMQSEGITWTYRAQWALLKGDSHGVLEAAAPALQQAEEVAKSRDFVYPVRNLVWVDWLMGAAHLELGNLVEAESHLGEALTRCRHINLVELEPDILLTWARWLCANGDRENALSCAAEALSIANRCEYRLKQAEIYNFLARWELEGENKLKAREHAKIAKERAWCDAPPHCYMPALDEAERLLELTSLSGKAAGRTQSGGQPVASPGTA